MSKFKPSTANNTRVTGSQKSVAGYTSLDWSPDARSISLGSWGGQAEIVNRQTMESRTVHLGSPVLANVWLAENALYSTLDGKLISVQDGSTTMIYDASKQRPFSCLAAQRSDRSKACQTVWAGNWNNELCLVDTRSKTIATHVGLPGKVHAMDATENLVVCIFRSI